ncbi:hypothetical protein RSOL_262630 [Rhizoctonia solani AG-3 Rhs1AP]|uniref:Uncharacterized protein n=1 Tax=Rhizoctonia solani AG-3 Rhs1AP TaxID=1086054 RepID=A0A0A1UJY9_9AGAM|nr:hypothetical protein RSOL_262630 [Rhizoctonia solani AG-3 Rhs1AP]
MCLYPVHATQLPNSGTFAAAKPLKPLLATNLTSTPSSESPPLPPNSSHPAYSARRHFSTSGGSKIKRPPMGYHVVFQF